MATRSSATAATATPKILGDDSNNTSGSSGNEQKMKVVFVDEANVLSVLPDIVCAVCHSAWIDPVGYRHFRIPHRGMLTKSVNACDDNRYKRHVIVLCVVNVLIIIYVIIEHVHHVIHQWLRASTKHHQVLH
jgi:hypothetical protein